MDVFGGVSNGLSVVGSVITIATAIGWMLVWYQKKKRKEAELDEEFKQRCERLRQTGSSLPGRNDLTALVLMELLDMHVEQLNARFSIRGANSMAMFATFFWGIAFASERYFFDSYFGASTILLAIAIFSLIQSFLRANWNAKACKRLETYQGIFKTLWLNHVESRLGRQSKKADPEGSADETLPT